MEKDYFICDGTVGNDSRLNIYIEKAEGNYLIDNYGKKYLDLRSGLWNTTLGYSKDLYSKINKQTAQMLQNSISYLDIHTFNNKYYDELSTKIIDFCRNDMFKCMFTNSGSESTDLSLKIVNSIKQQDIHILAFSESYHGSFFGGVSVSGIDKSINKDINKVYQNVTFIDFPINVEEESKVINYLKNNIHKFDAFFIEPILSSAGVVYSTTDFINSLLVLSKDNNVITIFDEVSTGFYRTGTPLYCDQLTLSPDIICLSKSINNGISPFGCICVNEYIYNELKNKPIHHFSTQNGNLISVTSANIVMDYYITNHERINDDIDRINTTILEELNKHKIPENSYRLKGSLLAIDTPDQDPLLLTKQLTELGILVYIYNSSYQGISIFPQYNIDTNTLKKALNIIIKKVFKK